MSKGSAKGADRKYQETCRQVLEYLHAELTPWSGDGIDVSFDLDDTRWTFDVALRTSDGSAVVAECKRHKKPLEQGHLGEFAWKVERLRAKLDVPVAAFCFAKSGHQIGSVRVGVHAGVKIVALGENAAPPGFSIEFYRFDAARERKLRNFVLQAPTGLYELKGTDAKLTHTKNDGTCETR